MKRAAIVVAALLVLGGGVVLALGLGAPPVKSRPEGWRREWEQLPLDAESAWSLDAVKRGAVQQGFLAATAELSRCVRVYRPPEGQHLRLELYTETVAEGTELEWVDVEPNPAVPTSFVRCLVSALEGGGVSPTPRVPAGTRWRIEYHFLVPPLTDLPEVPWWQRLFPGGWKAPRPSGNHVG